MHDTFPIHRKPPAGAQVPCAFPIFAVSFLKASPTIVAACAALTAEVEVTMVVQSGGAEKPPAGEAGRGDDLGGLIHE